MWIISASGPSSLAVALIAAGATLVGALVAGGTKYLADLRLQRARRRVEARISARIVYDDLTRCGFAAKIASDRLDLLSILAGALNARGADDDDDDAQPTAQAEKGQLTHQVDDAAVRRVEKSLEKMAEFVDGGADSQLASPAWHEYRVPLCADMANWIVVTYAITHLGAARSQIADLVRLADDFRDPQGAVPVMTLGVSLASAKITLVGAAVMLSRALDALRPVAEVSRGAHETALHTISWDDPEEQDDD
jgi:hypothetical protein